MKISAFFTCSGFSRLSRAPYAKHSRAFTLIELMFVITIIAILTMLSFNAYRGRQEEQRMQQCRSQVERVAHGFDTYKVNHSFYPDIDKAISIKEYRAAHPKDCEWLLDLSCPCEKDPAVASYMVQTATHTDGSECFSVWCNGKNSPHQKICNPGQPIYSSLKGKTSP